MGFLSLASLAGSMGWLRRLVRPHRRWRFAMVCLAATTISLGIPALSGCAGIDDVRAVRQDAAQLRDDLSAQIAAADAALAQHDALDDALGLPPDAPERASPQRAALAQARDHALATRNAVDAAIAQVDQILNEAQDPTDPLSMASRQLAPLVPGPWQAPLVLAGALAATFVRSRQLKSALLSVAHGIEVAKRRDPAFKDAFAKHADLFRIKQTATARRVVDEVTHD